MSRRCIKEGKVGAYVKHRVCQWDPTAMEGSP